MSRPKIASEQKSSIPVTTPEFTGIFFLLGFAAVVFTALLLGLQGRLRGGAGFWYSSAVMGVVFCVGLAFGYLRFRHKARTRSRSPQH